ncbi:MAG: glycosyltransferase family 4 protein [Myxococcota bacterium]
MRIALVVERFEPAGGVEGAAWATAHALVAEGCRVDVFAREGQEGRGPTLHRLPVGRGWQPRRVLAFSRAAARAAPRGQYDAVHSFSRTRHQDVVRTGGGCHAAYMERAYGRGGAALRRLSPRHAALLHLERAALRDPTQWVQCNSEMVRDEIQARYAVPAERIAVIPNGVDLQRFRPQPLDSELRTLRRGLGSGGRAAWLLVGHGFHRKGVDTAIRALAQAADREAVLWLAGRNLQGPASQLARELQVEDRVRCVDASQDVAQLYAAADALILPTRYDAFANVCLEAAASGLPIVTSAANGAARWLGEAGLCVEDPEDIEGFAATLDALGDADLRARLGGAARERAEQRPWSTTARELRALYERLTA